MAICYSKLWKLLIDKNLTKTELKNIAGISTNILAKMGKNESISIDSLEKICFALSCDIGDIIEIIPEKSYNKFITEPYNDISIYDTKYNELLNADWDFSSSKQDLVSLLHPYPARFIEDLPRQLISILGCPKGHIILDPFCGSGTTLVEAQRAGYNSVGIDINPIACLISRVKTMVLEDTFLETAKEIYNHACQAFYSNNIDIPNIPNIDHWFKKDIQNALSAINWSISSSKVSLKNREVLFFAMSSIIVKVSNQESDTRYAAVNKNITGSDTLNLFYTACKKIAIAKQETTFYTSAKIIEKDILSVKSREIGHNVGLVITSPPYPNAYEYWLYHKYRMWWLGYNPISVRNSEIGARPHYQKKNGQTEKDFEKQMNKVFSLLGKCVVSDGHICFIIGRSIIKGREIDNTLILNRAAKANGYKLIAKIPRKIATTRKSFNLSYGKINVENIMIYRRA